MDSNEIIYHDEINKNYKEIWKQMWLKNNCLPELEGLLALPNGSYTASLIMNICEEFELSSLIMFTAIDNYDLFFAKQFLFLKEQLIKNHNVSSDRIPFELYAILKRDYMLHIISVIQIVTKQIDKNLIIPMAMIESLLIKMDTPSNKTDIIKSEFIVFETLGLKIASSVCFDTIEFLIKTCLIVFTSHTTHFQKTCILVLEHSYLKRDLIYENSPTSLRTDKVLFGAAVIVATATIFKFPPNHLKHLVKLICENIPNSDNDLECLAVSILESGLVS